jgi:hypothetical protein
VFHTFGNTLGYGNVFKHYKWNGATAPLAAKSNNLSSYSSLAYKSTNYQPSLASASPLEDFEFSFNGDHNLSVIRYTGNDSDVIIPEVGIYDHPVTGRASGVFMGKSNITSVTIPDSVISMSDMVFAECENLVYVDMPASMEYMGQNVFQNCKSLARITVPDGLQFIQTSTFSGCESLSEVIIPDSVKGIGPWSFADGSFTSITLPEGLESIGAGAFGGCSNLTSVTVPRSVEFIDLNAFGYGWDAENLKYFPIDGFTIRGYKGTAAETYATQNGFDFIALDNRTDGLVSLKKSVLGVDNGGFNVFDVAAGKREILAETLSVSQNISKLNSAAPAVPTDLSFEESVNLGLTKIRHIELTRQEKEVLDSAVKKVSNTKSTEFEKLYSAWTDSVKSDEKMAVSNNAEDFKTASGYKNLANAVKTDKDLSYLVIQKYLDEKDVYSGTLFNEIIVGRNAETLALAEKIRDENNEISMNSLSGEYYIAPSAQANEMCFIKEILSANS